MAWRFLLAILLGGVCYLDRTAACQLMLHRPLVVATLMGAIFGNMAAGAQVGVVLELIYLARLPVGASIPPDDTGAAVFGGSAAAIASSSIGLDAGSFTALLLLSVVVAEAGKTADRFVRKVNVRIARITAESVDRGDVQAVEHGLLAGLTLFAVAGMALALVFSGGGRGGVEGVASPVRPRQPWELRGSPAGASAPGRRLCLFVQPHGADRRRLLPDDGGCIRRHRAVPVDDMTMPALATRSRSAVWRRQLLLQGCWNYEGMQNVGFAYAILPALRDFYANRPEEALKAVKRHLEFFNTQPAMGALILGATVRLEERVAAGEADPRSIGTFKVGLMGSLGAIGTPSSGAPCGRWPRWRGPSLRCSIPSWGSPPCCSSTTGSTCRFAGAVSPPHGGARGRGGLAQAGGAQRSDR